MKAFELYHPAVLFVYFLCVVLIGMFLFHPILQAEMLCGGILFCMMLQRKSAVLGNIAFYVPFFLMVALLNPLFSHNGVTPLFFLNGNPVTLEAVLYGIVIAVMVVGFVFWSKSYSEIMTTDKMLYLFGRIIPKLALVLSMALRFLPMLRRRIKTVGRAQKAMGLYSAKSMTDRVRGALRVFLAMIAWSLEHSVSVSCSMKARGYTSGRRTHFSLFRFSPRDAMLLAVCLAMTATVLVCAAFGSVSFRFYPAVSAVSFSFGAVSAYIAFGLLSFLPFMIELKEALTWKYCVSKI